ncbi:MAG: Gfo/Idh/MocA family oxidoreductase [Planctomycetaceae bacterium]|jgi:predicted dehydrogenase|nr:Gfo/Idh/MocA family oxidoreductase [Planctomycetaceae bacterium]
MRQSLNRRNFQGALVAGGIFAGMKSVSGAIDDRKYRVGIIGATGRGDYGHAVDMPFTKLPNVQIVALADANPKGLSQAKERLKPQNSYADYREMLSKESLDLVAICPRWIDQHFEMLMACAKANCHVYMEKPFCRTMIECDQVRKEFEDRKLKLAIAHTAQYSPVLDVAMELINDGAIGQVLELRGRGKEDHRGGAEDMWVLGSHIFALMRTFAKRDPASCVAQVTQNGEPIRKEHVVEGNEGLGPLAGDHVQVMYTFNDGVMGYFGSRKAMAASPSRFALQVFGSKGILEIESGYLAAAHLLRDGSWSSGRSGKNWERVTSAGVGKPEPIKAGSYEDGHLAAIKDLMLAIEQDRAPKCSLTDAIGITEMILGAFESQRVGQRVLLPSKTREHPLTLLV